MPQEPHNLRYLPYLLFGALTYIMLWLKTGSMVIPTIILIVGVASFGFISLVIGSEFIAAAVIIAIVVVTLKVLT